MRLGLERPGKHAPRGAHARQSVSVAPPRYYSVRAHSPVALCSARMRNKSESVPLIHQVLHCWSGVVVRMWQRNIGFSRVFARRDAESRVGASEHGGRFISRDGCRADGNGEGCAGAAMKLHAPRRQIALRLHVHVHYGYTY